MSAPSTNAPESSNVLDPWHDVQHTVIMCNFGGPTCEAEVEPFLRRLFEDPFIIRAPLGPRLRRWLAARLARRRAPKSNAEYKAIGYSPINRMTAAQARHLEAELRRQRPNTRVLVCNRYTAPSAAEVVSQLRLGQERLFLVTLYPHLCHSTTVSSLRDFDLALRQVPGGRDQESTRVFSWWQSPSYLAYGAERLAESLRPLLSASSDQPVQVLFSAHGIPRRYDERGDPYVNETRAHVAELVRRASALLSDVGVERLAQGCRWQLSFQSRVGPVEWAGPYTDAVIRQVGAERGGAILLVPISFTADHIETLYEMDHTYKTLALASGFSSYDRVRPANDDPALAKCLAEVLVQHGF